MHPGGRARPGGEDAAFLISAVLLFTVLLFTVLAHEFGVDALLGASRPSVLLFPPALALRPWTRPRPRNGTSPL